MELNKDMIDLKYIGIQLKKHRLKLQKHKMRLKYDRKLRNVCQPAISAFLSRVAYLHARHSARRMRAEQAM